MPAQSISRQLFRTLRTTTSTATTPQPSLPRTAMSAHRSPRILLLPSTSPLISRRALSTTPLTSVHYRPSSTWKGRHPDEHAVNRTDEKDVQSGPSHAAMREKERHTNADVNAKEGKGKGGEEPGKEDSGSQAISERDAGNSNKRAKEEISSKAPGPVIGMNDERGQKGN